MHYSDFKMHFSDFRNLGPYVGLGSCIQGLSSASLPPALSGSQWLALLDPNRWRFGIACSNCCIAGQTAARVQIAGFASLDVKEHVIFGITSQHGRIFAASLV